MGQSINKKARNNTNMTPGQDLGLVLPRNKDNVPTTRGLSEACNNLTAWTSADKS